jgi:hypothetical protein
MNPSSSSSRALAAVFALATGACHLAGADMHNLDELHWTDGRHKRTGVIWNDYEYAIRVGLREFLHGFGAKINEGSPEAIDDPLEICVNNLNDLIRHDSQDPWVAARQVEYCARIAVDDPWCLSREIAVRELAEHGERLDMREHPWVEPAADKATVEAVRDALARLVQAAGPVLRKESDTAQDAELAASCEAIGALVLDRQGALRLLRSVALIARGRDSNQKLAPLRDVGVRLQRTCLSQALIAALKDDPPPDHSGSDPGWRNGRVQAAAIEGCARVWGPSMLGKLMLDFSARDPDAERMLGFLHAVRDHGLPPVPDAVPEADRARAPDLWTETILIVATESPDDRVRLAAMAALGTISGRQPYSAREEDWQSWWLARKESSAQNGAP